MQHQFTWGGLFFWKSVILSHPNNYLIHCLCIDHDIKVVYYIPYFHLMIFQNRKSLHCAFIMRTKGLFNGKAFSISVLLIFTKERRKKCILKLSCDVVMNGHHRTAVSHRKLWQKRISMHLIIYSDKTHRDRQTDRLTEWQLSNLFLATLARQ